MVWEKCANPGPWFLLTGERTPNPGGDPAQETKAMSGIIDMQAATTRTAAKTAVTKVAGTAVVLAAVIAAGAGAPSAAAAPALPMLPLGPPACSQYGFTGDFGMKQDNGWQVFFTSTGSAASGRAVAVNGNTKGTGSVISGGVQGRNVDLTIHWDSGYNQHYFGAVGDDGYVHKGGTINQSDATSANWDSDRPLGCADAPPAPPPPPPPPPNTQTAGGLAVSVNGPTTLPAGLSGTYNVPVSNSGDSGAPVELFISYSGQLQQTGQVTPSGGFNCEVLNYAGGTSSVHCTVQQLQSKATANIMVQGRGSAPGAAQLDVHISSAAPGAQFVQASQQLHVTIT
jgi:hypothetical protein